MSESDQVCSACGAKGSLELELASGTLACNQCGVVASNSMNEAFEFLGRVDEEDEYTNGRMYVSDKNNAWGGGLAASGVRAMGGRAGQWAAGVGEKRTMFHAKKKVSHTLFTLYCPLTDHALSTRLSLKPTSGSSDFYIVSTQSLAGTRQSPYSVV